MKNILTLVLALLTILISGCGGSGTDMSLFCDGDILIPFQEKKGKDWGFINLKGEIVLDPEFEEMPSFASNGIARISKYSKKDKKHKYMFAKIANGKAEVSKEQWDLAGEFREGLAPVRNDNEKVQFIDENFKQVFTAEAEEVSYFNEGLAAFRDKDNKWGFMNKTGEISIKAEYDFVQTGFSNGFAIVGTREEGDRYYMVIDKTGKEKLNLKDKYAHVHSISEGLIHVSDRDGHGFIDLEGNKVVKLNDEWSNLTDMVNGYASFREDREWGLIDKQGKTIFKSKYEVPLFVFNGKIWYMEDDEWGVMDLEGKDIIEPEFKAQSYPYPWMCETTIVQDRSNYIFIDKEGKEFSKNEYDNVAGFEFRYINNQPWNTTFDSDHFDASTVTNVINKAMFQVKNGTDLAKQFELDPQLFWGRYSRSFREIGSKIQFYDEYSTAYSFMAYQYDYTSEYDNLEVEEAETEAAYDAEDYDEPYYDPYDEMYDYTEDAPVEEIESKYPLPAPSGIDEIRYTFTFDDYLGITQLMSMDDARAYYAQETSQKTLELNKDAKLLRANVSVTLNKKGYGKAKVVAERIASDWKRSITKVIDEKSDDKSFRLEGETTDGTIIIRTVGSSNVMIEYRKKRTGGES